MTRHNQDNRSTTTHNRNRRFLAASLVALVTLMFVFGMVLRPMAFAQSTGKTLRANNAAQAAATDAKSATVLVYMNGSDLESEAGEASSDIAEMLESGSSAGAYNVLTGLGEALDRQVPGAIIWCVIGIAVIVLIQVLSRKKN